MKRRRLVLVFLLLCTGIHSQTSDPGVTSTGAALGNHAFTGTHVDSTFPDWLGTGYSATAYNLLGYSSRYWGFGGATGNNIESPIIWMYANPRSALRVRTMKYNGDMTTGVDLLTVRANGNIGMGTTTPDGKLHIYGSNANTTNLVLSANYEDKFRWRLNTIDRGNAIDLDITSSDLSDNQEAVLKLSRSNSSRPEFQLYNNAIVANNGNVGIGNASPSEKLDVTGNIAANTMLLRDPINTSDWNLVWQSGFYQSYNASNAPESGQWFWGVNLNHSSNSSTYRYNGQIAIKNSNTNPTMYFRSTNVNGIGTWARLVHSEGNQFINGNLGIGTTTPDAKLTVKGNIHAEEVKVDLSVPGPDYVFKKGYDLKSLEEVQSYIKANGHLPNIPSAKTMESNGIDLGVMNMKLLEKIEELTLYVIQLRSENKDLEESLLQKKEEQGDMNERLKKIEQLIKIKKQQK